MAGTVTETFQKRSSVDKNTGKRCQFTELTLACVADVSDGSYPSTAISDYLNDILGLWCFQVITVPGATGPTDNSNFTLTDKYGVDILNTKGANAIDNATNNYIWPEFNGIFSYPMTGTLTLAITGNSVNSAAFSVILLFSEYPVHYVAVS